MKYQNRKNNKIATLAREDAERKTVILEFEDGSNTTVTTSTLKRWWKKIDDADTEFALNEPVAEDTTDAEYVAEVMQQKKDLGIECPEIDPEKVEVKVIDPDVAGDGTSLAEVGKEIYEQAKKKAKKAKVEKANKKRNSKRVDRTPVWEKLGKEIASIKSVSEFRDRGAFIASVWVEGKTLLEVRLSQKGGTVRVRPALADKCELQYSLVNNYYLGAFVKLEDDEIVQTIKTLVKGGN